MVPESAAPAIAPASLFERIGGVPAIKAAVDLFYTKVLADPALAPYFATTNLARLKARQNAFFITALGGPGVYKGRDMKPAHAGMGITRDHFDRTAKHLADFRLTERSGTAVTLADVRGKMVVVSFVFTSCGTTCLAVTKQMAEVQKQTAGQDDLRLLSITVDPKTDTPAVLTKFADRVAADPRRWLYLTGDKKPIWELLEATFLEPEDDGDVFLANPDGSPPTRTPLVRRILVFDRTGAARACFNGMDDGAATGVVQTLAALRAGKVVVSANKALICEHGAEIMAAARRHGGHFFFEASVAGGIPIIKALREGLVANRFTRIYGILNGTCNYILTRMKEQGAPYAEVLADAIADLETPKGAVGSRPQLMVNVSVATANNAARRKTRGRLGPTVTWPMDPPAPCRS